MPIPTGSRNNTFPGSCALVTTLMEHGSGSSDSAVRVELYVRSLSPRESRRKIERVVERLERLVEDGVIADYRVVPTGAELPATPADAVTAYGEYLCRRLDVFEEWAAASGRSLGSVLERRTVDSAFTGEVHDALVVPTMLMAEYDGTALRFVAPCDADGERVSVMDRLDALALGVAAAEEQLLPGAGVRGPPDPTLVE